MGGSAESLRVIEYNLLFKYNIFLQEVMVFNHTPKEVEEIKIYIRGSIKEMQSLLIDVENNIPMVGEKVSRAEDKKICGGCNFLRVCRF